MTSKASIVVKFKQVGFHHWPDAPTAHAYLAQPHRHTFHVTAQTQVDHDHCEIDFHDLLDEARRCFATMRIGSPERDRLNFGPQSCEILARRLGTMLADLHRRPFTVTVSEDGECGAIVTSKPDGAE